MASMTNRRFTDGFTPEAVALWETGGRKQTEVAADMGIMPTMLRRWQRRLGDGSAAPAGPAAKWPVSVMTSPADRASEIARLCREWDRARMERDILGKAVGIFAEMPLGHGLIRCLDRGSQYAAGTYVDHLAASSATPSMSRTGNRHDNAPMESFFHTLKSPPRRRPGSNSSISTNGRHTPKLGRRCSDTSKAVTTGTACTRPLGILRPEKTSRA